MLPVSAGWLLDELQGITGYHRKSLLWLLNRKVSAAAVAVDGACGEQGECPSALKPHPRRRYGPEAAAALVPLWEASDRLCGKRLVALLPLLVESLESHGHLNLEPGVGGVPPSGVNPWAQHRLRRC